MVRLVTGSEGTLGIITEATLRLHGQPEAVGSSVCSFPDLRTAVDTVIELIQTGAPVSRIEFLDEVQVRACNAYSKLSLPEQPTLFIEFMGTEAAVTEHFERAVDLVKAHGAERLDWSFDAQRRAALWKARHAACFAARALRPGTDCIVADVCVPIPAVMRRACCSLQCYLRSVRLWSFGSALASNALRPYGGRCDHIPAYH